MLVNCSLKLEILLQDNFAGEYLMAINNLMVNKFGDVKNLEVSIIL